LDLPKPRILKTRMVVVVVLLLVLLPILPGTP
jgi:hypothetical protein